jgi:hypothetical protein
MTGTTRFRHGYAIQSGKPPRKAIREADRAAGGPSAWKASAGRPRARALDPDAGPRLPARVLVLGGLEPRRLAAQAPDRAACRKAVRVSRRDRQRCAWCGCPRVKAPHFDGPIPISMLWCARFFLPQGAAKSSPCDPRTAFCSHLCQKHLGKAPVTVCPLHPRKRTSSARPTMSETWQEETFPRTGRENGRPNAERPLTAHSTCQRATA